MADVDTDIIKKVGKLNEALMSIGSPLTSRQFDAVVELFRTSSREAYKKGYIDGGISVHNEQL